MKAVFDTNILIDHLLGHSLAKEEIKLYKDPQISIITKMEVLIGATEDTEELIMDFLDNFTVIALNEEIAQQAILVRKEFKIKLPDAIVWATAKHTRSLLVTRNTKDFPFSAPDLRFPYNII